MRNRLLGVLAAAALAGAAGTGPAAAPAATPVKASIACVNARIEGDRVCIAAEQFCRHRASANRDYHRYGYHCGKRDRNGSYHLLRR